MRLFYFPVLIGLLFQSSALSIHPRDQYVPGEIVIQTSVTINTIPGNTNKTVVSDPLTPVLQNAGAVGVTALLPGDAALNVKSRTKYTRPAQQLYLVKFAPDISIPQMVERLSGTTGILKAEPNYIGTLSYVPTDPLYAETADHFARIGLEDAWEVQQGGDPSLVVAVIDSGVDANHVDLNDAIHPNSYNFVESNYNVFDDLGHGTRVAGIIAAEGNNGDGIAGVAFGSKVLSCDVVDAAGVLTSARVITALNYAVAQGAKVINMSIQFYAQSALLEQACDDASASAVLVASAGNENQGDSPVYPASYDSVIGVGATMLNTDDRAPFSNYNGTDKTLVDLVAPGVNIYTTIPASGYDGVYTSGTSFTAPMVAGVAALLESKYSAQSPAGIVAHLIQTATPTAAWSDIAGLVSAKIALETTPLPDLSLASIQVDDSTSIYIGNDHDGSWDKGETVDLIVSLENTKSDAINVTGILSSTDSDVTIDDNAASWGNIAPEEILAASNIFRVTASSSAISHNASFDLALTSNSGGYTPSLTLTVRVESAQQVAANSWFALQHWTADKVWEINGTQNFNAGLKVDPGTVVKVAPGADLNINGGTFSAVGTAIKPILFTSLKEPAFTESLIGPHTIPVNLIAFHQVRYVDASHGSDLTGIGTQSNPWATISHSLSQITDSGPSNRYCVLVAEGYYDEVSCWAKRYVELYGGFDSNDWSRDIVNNASVCGLYMSIGSLNDHVRIDGFTFYYGGIHGNYSSFATISNNVFLGPGKYYSGTYNSGIYIEHGVSTVAENNIITGDPQVAIDTVWSSPTIVKGNIVCENEYGISCGNQNIANASAVVTDNLCIGNAYVGISLDIADSYLANNICAYNATGIQIYYRSISQVWNCIIVKNGLGLFFRPVDSIYPGGTITNSIVYDNYTELDYVMPPDITYSDVRGGYYGTANINTDPLFVGLSRFGMISHMTYDAKTCRTTLVTTEDDLPSGRLINQVMRIGYVSYPIVTNTNSEIIVYGDATSGRNVPIKWEIFDFHLRKGSPCIDYGTNAGSLATDMDMEMRPIDGGTGLFSDIGADEFYPANVPYAPWGALYIKNSVVSASMEHCTVENGKGVLAECANSKFTNSLFLANTDSGLESTSGSSAIRSCTANKNYAGGVTASSRTLSNCVAIANQGNGLVGAGLSICKVMMNGADGATGISAIQVEAMTNAGVGLQVSGPVTSCTANDNLSNGIVCISGNVIGNSTLRNKSRGIVKSGSGTVSDCNVSLNLLGGINTNGSNVTSCQVVDNGSIGVSGSGASTISNSLIKGSTGAAISGIQTITNCRVINNQSGVSGTTTINGSYIAGNAAAGVTGGTLSNSTVVGNKVNGIEAPQAVINTWIAYNKGIGINGPAGNVTYCSILNNAGYGVRNLASGRVLNNCNIYGNQTYDYYDNLNNASGGYPNNVKDCRFNYWGPTTAAWMQTNRFPSISCPLIYDLFDNGLTNGWYINYGGDSPWNPVAPNFPVPNAPDTQPPAFLLDVVPNLANAVNVGLATFTLTFSEPMDTAIAPVVTFDATAPFTRNVVEPVGWLNNTTWQGTFAVGIGTGDGLNTIRVAEAKAADGFIIPDDTAHQFNIDTAPGTGTTNGVAIPLSNTTMRVKWDPSPNSDLIGYSIVRALKEDGPYILVNNVVASVTEYIDTGLSGGTDYYYQIREYDASFNSRELTSPFFSTTMGTTPSPTSTGGATHTPTITQIPTITPTRTPTFTSGGPTLTATPTPISTHTPNTVLTPTPVLTVTSTPTPRSDLNNDGCVDYNDLMILMSEWHRNDSVQGE